MHNLGLLIVLVALFLIFVTVNKMRTAPNETTTIYNTTDSANRVVYKIETPTIQYDLGSFAYWDTYNYPNRYHYGITTDQTSVVPMSYYRLGARYRYPYYSTANRYRYWL